jgi:hypothetical protein
MPSADPDELRANIEGEIERAVDPETRAIWPIDGLFKPEVDKDLLAAFVSTYELPEIAAVGAAPTWRPLGSPRSPIRRQDTRGPRRRHPSG